MSRLGFQALADDLGAIFNKIAVLGAESCREVAVDIKFTRNFAPQKNRDYNFRLGFDRAREIALIF